MNVRLFLATALIVVLSVSAFAGPAVTNVWVDATSASVKINNAKSWQGGTAPSGTTGTGGIDQAFDFTVPLSGIGVQTITTPDNHYPTMGYLIGGKERQILANGYANRSFAIRDWSGFLGRYFSDVFGRLIYAYPTAAENMTATVNDVHSRREARLNMMTDGGTLRIGTLSGLGYISLNKDNNNTTQPTSSFEIVNFPVDESTRVTFQKGKKVSLPGRTVPEALPGDPYLVLDASVSSSLVPTTGSDSREYVGRWNDARGGEGRPYATSGDTAKMPWADVDSTGKKVVNFGYSICDFKGADDLPIDMFTNGVNIGYRGYNGPTLGRTAWMSLSEKMTNIREAFFVVRDREAADGWGQWLGSPSGETQHFRRRLIRAGFNEFMTDAAIGLFKGTTAMRLGDVRLDGARTDYNHMDSLADAIHVVSVGFEGTAAADRIGNNGKTVFKESDAGYARGFAVGGFTLAEMVLYTNALTVAERTQINAYLKKKWLTGDRANNYSFDELNVVQNYITTQLPAAPVADVEVPSGELRLRKLTVGGKPRDLVKSGAGTLAVEKMTAGLRVKVTGGDLKFKKTTINTTKAIPTAPAPGAAVWLDAENLDSMVVSNAVDGSGKVFVKTWRHAENGGINYMHRPAHAQFDGGSYWNVGTAGSIYRYPTRVTSDKLGGKHVLDFGTFKKLDTSSDEYKTYGSFGDPADGCAAMRIGTTRRDTGAFGGICVRDGFIVVRAKHKMANIISDGNQNIYREYSSGALFDGSQSVPVFNGYWAINAVPFQPNIGIGDFEFRLFSYRLPNDNTTLAGLGIARGSDTWLGGIDVAEVIQYDHRLTDEEFRDTEAYLLKKWFDKTHPNYTADEGSASIDALTYAADVEPKITTEIPVAVGAVKTASGTVQVSGAGPVSIASITTNAQDFAVDGGALSAEQDWLADAALHFDASKADTIVYRTGYEADRRISRWLDSRKNGWYAECYLTDSKSRVYTNATYEAAADNTSGLLAGSNYVDFGDGDSAIEQAGMRFFQSGVYNKYGNLVEQGLRVREYHIVYCLTRTGNYPPVGGNEGLGVHAMVPMGNMTEMFYGNCTAGQWSRKRVDGSDWYTSNKYQPSGKAVDATKFYVQSIVASDYMNAASLAMDRASTRGNVKICEVIFFTGNTNTTARTEAIHAYLRKKWKGVGDGAGLSAAVGTVALTNGGKLTLANDVTLGADARITASVTATGTSAFTVGGTLTVEPGAQLTIAVDESVARPKGSWTVLSAGAVVHPENLQVRVEGGPRAVKSARVSWEDGTLKLRFASPGAAVYVR